jgi:predicted HTH transcriptional regulator
MKIVIRDISSLKEKGVIARIGSDKGGYWMVPEKNEY